jgi:SAM-dependent methyltransferase
VKCRFCNSALETVFADFGAQPPSNAYLRSDDLLLPEVSYPLRVYVCHDCLLVQVPEFKASRDIFNADYAYFSGVSQSWLQHCEAYATRMIAERRLDVDSLIVELASNDGYLLQFFSAASIPCYGVEPSASVATAAQQKGIDTVVDFFGDDVSRTLLDSRGPADLIVANNVLAHVPDLNDFVSGIARLLHKDGLFTGEFPHLLELIERNAFDTIYHEHYSYFSLKTIQAVFAQAGLTIFDVEVLPTHGGSLRIHAAHAGIEVTASVAAVLQREQQAGIHQIAGYSGFQSCCETVKNDFLRTVLAAKHAGERLAAYGAAAKSNTFLNYCGVQPDLLPYVADLSVAKQGMFLPGSRIPIVSPEHLYRDNPDLVFILPWNLKREIATQLRQRGVTGKLVTAVPRIEVHTD